MSSMFNWVAVVLSAVICCWTVASLLASGVIHANHQTMSNTITMPVTMSTTFDFSKPKLIPCSRFMMAP